MNFKKKKTKKTLLCRFELPRMDDKNTLLVETTAVIPKSVLGIFKKAILLEVVINDLESFTR